MADESSDDEEYAGFGGGAESHHHLLDGRYPVHDCCEFDDVEALKNLILIVADDSDEDDDDDDDDDDDEGESENDTACSRNQQEGADRVEGGRAGGKVKGDDSSSDDNDSTAAAHAAAIGHSPRPIKQTADGSAPATDDDGTPATESDAHATKGIQKETDAGVEKEANGSKNAINKYNNNSHKSEESLDVKSTVENARPPAVNEAVNQGKDETETPEKNSSSSNFQPVNTCAAMEIDEAQKEVPEKPEPVGEHVSKVNSPDDSSVADASVPKPAPKPRTRVRRTEVNNEINLNERDEDESTPLHVAIHARKLEHVKVLLEVGASFRMKCDGSWPVHTAISMGAIRKHKQFAYECLVALHEAGADLTVKDDSMHTPLYLACMFNLPEIVSYILSDNEGLSTLMARGDRAGNRPLQAAAKYDTLDNPSFSKNAAASVTGQIRAVSHHHPDGSVDTALHSIPGFRGKLETTMLIQSPSPARTDGSASVAAATTEALLTQILLGTNGVEVDATNFMGQTALHMGCLRGNWPAVRLLLQAGASPAITDRRGFTPGQLAYKRGMPIPNDLVETLADPPETGIIPPLRDLIVDPNAPTLLISHELCTIHRTCPPIRRDASEAPPENVRRLHVLIDKETGILRSGEFGSLMWQGEARRAAMGDILKVHDYTYVERICQLTSSIPDHPNAIAHLDPDTTISRWSFEAALRAAGSVCQAVDLVVAGDCRNSFCAVRPPGHHAGPRGIVRCANDPEGGSHGFCLLNNVAIGAAYARSMYRNDGIRRVAIVDFDVHHGNGTEAIIQQLVPNTERTTIRTPFAFGEMSTSTYRPWLDETDIHNIFFSSTHGYGHRGFDQAGWFYPASGKSHTSEAITHPVMVESPNLSDFILSQTWARMGEESKVNCCKIINVGFDLPEPDIDPQSRSMKQRMELRDTYRKKILPYLREFDPDIIFISAGFDAHRKDSMNFGYVGMVEDDYEWITEQLVKVANTCCNGRIVSVLEGGYRIHGGIVSPFARSVASHVRALVDGGRSRELYDPHDGEWESKFEHNQFDKRERKKEQERGHLRQVELQSNRRAFFDGFVADGDAPEDPDAPSRKRRRNQPDYRELLRRIQQDEGFGG